MTQSQQYHPSDESLVEAGLVGNREAVDTLIKRYQDPGKLQFIDTAVSDAVDIAEKNREIFNRLVERGIGHLYRHHPTLSTPDIASALRMLICHDKFQSLLNLEPLNLEP